MVPVKREKVQVTFSRRAWKTVYYHLKRKVPYVEWEKYPDPALSTEAERTFPWYLANSMVKVWQYPDKHTPESKHQLRVKAIGRHQLVISCHHRLKGLAITVDDI